MQEVFSLWQSAPWLVIGGGLIAVNLILLALKITKKLIILGIGAALVAIGLYTGLIEAPAALLHTPVFASLALL